MVSRQDTGGETGFGSDHAGGVSGATRGSSARGRGRRHLPGWSTMSQEAAGLDMARGGFETGGALIEGTVDMDVSEFPALEAGLVVSEMVTRQGNVVVTAGPPNFGMFKSDFFFFGQRGR